MGRNTLCSLLCCCSRINLFKENVSSWSNMKVSQGNQCRLTLIERRTTCHWFRRTLTALPRPDITAPVWSRPEPSLSSSGNTTWPHTPAPCPIPISKRPEKVLVSPSPSQILNSLFKCLIHSLHCIFASLVGFFLSYKSLLIVACTFPLSEEPITSF